MVEMVFFCWEEDAEEELDREDAECRKDRDHPLSVCERNDTEDGVEWREEHNSELDEDLSEPDEEVEEDREVMLREDMHTGIKQKFPAEPVSEEQSTPRNLLLSSLTTHNLARFISVCDIIRPPSEEDE